MWRDLLSNLKPELQNIRGRLSVNEDLSPITWFRTGGPAQLFYAPADIDDLAEFMSILPADIPVLPIGLGSNLLIRDGGIQGVVIRLGRGFNQVEVEDNCRIRVGTAVPDMRLANTAAKANIDGLTFYRGIPGGIGGALRMNAGCYGIETKDRLISLKAVTRQGEIITLGNADMSYSYRHSDQPSDMVFVEALFEGFTGNMADIEAEMQTITEQREGSQPTKSRTGGSTFKNPPENKSWQLIDAAGCRGLTIGEAQVSEKHCNFLINQGNATAHDLETLGETVRKRVFETSGIRLQWEIKRLGQFLDGESVEEFLGM